MIEFTVYGEPQVKQRPRFKRVGKFVQTYTPTETLAYEKKIKKAYQEQIGDYLLEEIPIKVTIIAYFQIPKSFNKTKTQLALDNIIKPHTRKDVDNIAKICLDGMNKVVYADDRQVTDLIVRKRYSDQPRVEIRINEVKE